MGARSISDLITTSQPINISNLEFLTGIFGNRWQWAYVTGFRTVVDDASPSDWSGTYAGQQLGTWHGALEDQAANQYFCVSQFSEMDDGRARRSKAFFAAQYCLIIDDVGSGEGAKVGLDVLAGKILPSWVLESSPLELSAADLGAWAALYSGCVSSWGLALAPPRVRDSWAGTGRGGSGGENDGFVFEVLDRAGLLGHPQGNGYIEVECINAAAHSVQDNRTGYNPDEGYQCFHGSCEHLTSGDLVQWLKAEHADVWNAVREERHAVDVNEVFKDYLQVKPEGMVDQTDQEAEVIATAKTIEPGDILSMRQLVHAVVSMPEDIQQEMGRILKERKVKGKVAFEKLVKEAATATGMVEAPQAEFDGLVQDEVALDFVAEYQHKLAYCADWGKWFIWDGQVWNKDATVAVYDMVRGFIRGQVAGKQGTGQVLNSGYIAGAERLARSDQRVAVVPEAWDQGDWILNTPAGIVDLTTGAVMPHAPERMLTKITTVSPNSETPSRWLSFLDETTDGDKDLQSYLQRLTGYTLTGSTAEQMLAFLYGTGRNGKGVFIRTLNHIHGPYATVAPMETFTETKWDRHETELAMLRGSRLVTAQETEQGKRWSEARIKSLTGGDPITDRFMKQDHFTFLPTWISQTNNLGLDSYSQAQ